MGCIIEFSESLIQFEFNSHSDKQKILVDVLLKYSDMSIEDLASFLEVSVKKLRDIQTGKGLFRGERANDLAQLFLVFFGRIFFTKFSIIRNY